MTGEQVKEARLRLGLSCRDLAAAIGWAPTRANARRVRRLELEGANGKAEHALQQLLAQQADQAA